MRRVIIDWAAIFIAVLCVVAVSRADLVINEFMADNATTVSDPEGDEDDWIEIYNSGSTDIDVAGMYLTDNLGNPTMHRIDTNSLIIGPGNHLVFWADNDTVDGPMHLNFSLGAAGEQIGLYDTDGSTLIDSITFGQQLPDVSYGRYPDGSGDWRSMNIPTPGDVNNIGAAGPVEVSEPSRTFMTTLSVTLTATNNADGIRYTLDGSVPTGASLAYGSPLAITNSTVLRARAFKSGMEDGPVVSSHYILLADDAIRTLQSKLPILLVDSFGGAIPDNDPRQFTYMAIFEPGANGLTSVTNLPTLSTRAGMEYRGNSTIGYEKKQLRIETWLDDRDEEKDISPFGMSSDGDWLTISGYEFDRALMRPSLIFDLDRQIGNWSPRTIFVEVFINTTGGAMSYAGNYQGVSAFGEEISRAADRIDLARLDPDDTTEPDVTGGYMFEHDRETDFSAGGLTKLGWEYPGRETMNSAPYATQKQWLINYMNEAKSVLDGAGFDDPETGYAKYIDVESYIDYHWFTFLAEDPDAYPLSTFYHKHRGGKLRMGPHWDFDRTMESTDGRDNNPYSWLRSGMNADYFKWGWLNRLFQDIEFWQQWIDRWFEHRDGTLSTTNVNAVINSMSNSIGIEAAARNFARWENPRTSGGWASGELDGTWSGEVRHMAAYLEARSSWIDDQFLARPTYNQEGGFITGGSELVISGPVGATTYYTLDGTDPRAPGGAPSASALEYTAPMLLSSNVIVISRAFDSTWVNGAWQSGDVFATTLPWSAPGVAVFMVAPHTVAITEVMYNPRDPETGTAEINYATSDFEFVEISNTGDARVDLAGLRFSDGILFDWSYGSVPSLEIGESAIVVNNLAAFTNRYPDWGTIKIAGEYEGSLNDAGESIRLESVTGQAVSVFSYNDSRGWPLAADGVGHSLVATELDHQATGSLSYGGNWRASTYIDGSPGEANPDPIRDIVLNELAAHTDTEEDPPLDSDDWIELFNATTGTVTLTSWYLSDSASDLKKWQIPASNTIEASGWIAFTERNAFNTEGTNGFGLNKAGEQIFLSYLPGTSEDRVADCIRFKGQENGATLGRYADGEDYWLTTTPTPGTTNALAAADVVINQFMPHPAPTVAHPEDNTNDEYIVFYNPTDAPIELWNEEGPWRIDSGVDYTFPSNTSIGAQDYLTVVSFAPTNTAAMTAFEAAYGLTNSGLYILGPYNGKLSNDGERIALERPQAPDQPGDSISWVIVDEVIYATQPPWPDVTTNGLALQRAYVRRSGNDPANWVAVPASLTAAKVLITSPAAGSTQYVPFIAPFSAVIDDSQVSGSVQRVEFYLDGTNQIAVDTLAPYETTLNYALISQPGTYRLRADMIDASGTNSSVEIAINAAWADRIDIVSPVDGLQVVAPYAAIFEAEVPPEHIVGSIAQVSFYDGTELLGSDASAPYQIALDQTNVMPTGWHELTAEVTDDFGTSTSETVRVHVYESTYKDWSHRMKIRIPGYDGHETLEDFALPVKLHEGVGEFRYADVGDPADGGASLRFADATGTNTLFHEIEWWDTSGTSTVWVKLDKLRGRESFIWAYWGNASATLPSYATDGSVWPGYDLVYHLAQSGEEDAVDSTSNSVSSTDNGGTFAWDQPGVMGPAVMLSGNRAGLRLSETIPIEDAWTISAWIRDMPAGLTTRVMAETLKNSRIAEVYGESYDLGVAEYVSEVGIVFSDSGSDMTVPAGQWHHLAVVGAGGSTRFYVNGDLAGVCPETQIVNDDIKRLGNAGTWGGKKLASLIDEYRLGPHVRSADWVRACWLSVASNDVFLAYETAENNRPGSLPLVDADGDGMRDVWEIKHFGSTNATADADADNDGMNNGGEFIAGTDPTNAASVFRLGSRSAEGAMVVDFMALDAAPYGEGYSRWYSLERATNLLAPQWGGVPGYTNILGADQGVSYTSPAAPAQFLKGRVRLEE